MLISEIFLSLTINKNQHIFIIIFCLFTVTDKYIVPKDLGNQSCQPELSPPGFYIDNNSNHFHTHVYVISKNKHFYENVYK